MLAAFHSRGLRLVRARAALLALAMVSGLSIASSAIGFIFQMVLAARFGAGAAIDHYLFAISAPTFLAGLGAASLSYTIIPALVLVEKDQTRRAAVLHRLQRRVGALAIVFLLLGLPAAFIQPLLLPAKPAPHQIAILHVMISLGWAIGGVQILTALFVIELNAARRPIAAALLALYPNIGAIVVVLLSPNSILAAPAGVLFGSLAAMMIGMLLTRRSFAARVGMELLSIDTGMRPARIAWTLIAMSCFSAYAVIDAFWAPRASSGTLATLGYAQRLVIGIGGLILAGPSAVLTPRLAAVLRDRGGAAFLRTAMQLVAIVVFVAGAAAIVLALLAGPLIGAAFGRGAFGVEDVARVSTVFRTMLPGFCAMLASVVLTRAIYCLPTVERSMAMVGLIWSLVYFSACGAFLHLGGVGFGIAYSFAWGVYMLIAVAVLYRYARRTSISCPADLGC